MFLKLANFLNLFFHKNHNPAMPKFYYNIRSEESFDKGSTTDFLTQT